MGGSLASSVRGIPRATYDIDPVIEMTSRRVDHVASALGQDWYFDVEMARKSLQHNRAFDVIHMFSSHRFDFFPAYTAFHASELKRATREALRFPGGEVQCFVASNEDSIVAKLRWYREGGEVSDRQWSDITGMLIVNRDLDFDYLQVWAQSLGVVDLLARAVKLAIEPM